jgi:alpha/beta superfamily hydrolase
MTEEIRIAGSRDVRGTIDTPDADSAVVACPPHPEFGGTRSDPRLRAVGTALSERAVACLRFDYGPWDRGDGERQDTRNAIAFARDRYDAVGLFGYSFGAAVALLTAADSDPDPAALSVLAPPAAAGEFEVVSAFEGIGSPVQVAYGERDSTVEWQPIVERARERGCVVEAYQADHFFVGQVESVGDRVAVFFERALV